jgi:hypothetical protein
VRFKTGLSKIKTLINGICRRQLAESGSDASQNPTAACGAALEELGSSSHAICLADCSEFLMVRNVWAAKLKTLSTKNICDANFGR